MGEARAKCNSPIHAALGTSNKPKLPATTPSSKHAVKTGDDGRSMGMDTM